jgi:predicted glycosyltransferase
MPPEVRQRLCRRAAAHPRLHVVPFVRDTGALLGRADRVIAMGGYNTVCEVLSYEKPALIVPRVQPRREQLIRAERLRDLGLLDLLHPEDVSPRALTEWLAQDLPPRRPVRSRIDLNGLAKLPALLAELLDAPPRRGRCVHLERRLPHGVR